MESLHLHGRLHIAGAGGSRGDVQPQQQTPGRGEDPERHRPGSANREREQGAQSSQSAPDAIPDLAGDAPVEAEDLNVSEKKSLVGLLETAGGNLEQVVRGQVKRHMRGHRASRTWQTSIGVGGTGHDQ